MTATLRALKSALDVKGAQDSTVASGITVDALFRQQSKAYQGPTKSVLCAINGKNIHSKKWKTHVVQPGDVVAVCPRVMGLDPFSIALIISVGLVALAFASQSIPNIDSDENIPEQSPSYNLDAQGNKAKLGKVIPVRYGRFRVYPDFASEPYKRYINDDQYLYQLFALGQGEFDKADLKIGDTPIGNFDEIDSEFYAPGQKVTLFKDAVNVSPDVTNTTLFAPNEPEYSGWTGPFVANDADTVVEELAIDVVLPQGLFYSNDEGGLDARSVTVQFEYRDIDANGDPVGSWSEFAVKNYSAATVDAIRKTIEGPITTTTGRVQVRGRRTNSSTDDFKEKDEIRWTGLKAFLESDQTYDHSVWAVKAKATDNLSSQNERKFNLVLTRKLPVWDGAQWLPIEATRNPAWAFCDALKAEYGGRYQDKNIDLDAIKTLADLWESRGDYFDGQFDTKSTLWPALKKICFVGRAYPYQYGDNFTIVRDGPETRGFYTFNGRNIKAKSLSAGYITPADRKDDSVEIEYTDPISWKPETITAAVPGSSASEPRKIKVPSITNRLQAHREAMFIAAKTRYRNVTTRFKTELDGRVLDYLDRALITHDVSKWGSGGEIVEVSGQVLILSEPVEFELSGDHFVYLRDDTGQAHGPYQCISNGSDDEINVLDTLPGFIYTGDDKEKTYFSFVAPSSVPRQMLIEDVSADGETGVSVRAILDNPIVHSFDAQINAGTIITPPPTPPPEQVDFVISNLVIIQGGTISQPKVQLSWSPAEDAFRYLIDVSYDGGDSWSRAATVLNNSAIIDVLPGEVDIRIAPQNDEVGLWYQAQVTTGSDFTSPPTPTGLALESIFDDIKVDVSWDSHVTAASWFVEVVDLSSNVQHSQVLTTPQFTYTHALALIQNVGREFDIHVKAVNANGVKSTAAAILRVKNEQTAKLSAVTAIGLIDNIVVSWPEPTEPDNNGFNIYASQTQGFVPSVFNLIDKDIKTLVYQFASSNDQPWYIRVAGVDIWGNDELNFSDEISANTTTIKQSQVADDFIITPMLAANSVTADKVTVSNLSAISAVLGTITSGTYKTSSLLGHRVEMSSEGNWPIWYGTGAKTAENGKFYFDKNGNGTLRGINIYDNQGNLVMSSGGALQAQIAAGNVTGLGSLATQSSVSSSQVSGLGAFSGLDALNADNVLTYIAYAAIPRSRMGALQVDTADIQTAAVETLTVAGRAITNPISAYTAGSKTISGAAEQGSYINVQSATIVATGQPITIIASAALVVGDTDNGDDAGARIRRGGSTRYQSNIGEVGSQGQGVMMSLSITDVPPPGTHTYYFDMAAGEGQSSARNRSLMLMETKR